MNETEEQTSQEILSLDDIYFKDAFTKTEDKLNLEINNVDIDCMTSRNNKFSLDNNGNLIVNSITTNSINAQNILDMIYPIGSIYSSRQNVNPSTLFGGTWTPIKDKFLLCAGDEYSAGTTGGEAAHKLTVNEMPAHTHQSYQDSGGNVWNYQVTEKQTGKGTWHGNGHNLLSDTGGNQFHNNMPPYLTVYVWERTA